MKTQIRALEKDNDEITYDQFAIATELNKYFHSMYVEDNVASNIESDYVSENLLETVIITQKNVESRLKALEKSKSVGYDLVHPHVLKECSTSICSPFFLVFKKSIETGTLPDI